MENDNNNSDETGFSLDPEDMEKMWNHPIVSKEWSKSGEKQGKVRFSHDAENRPYLSRVELRAITEIILSKHFSTRGVKPTVLCALAEIVSMRFVNGVGPRPGITGIDYPIACWLYKYGKDPTVCCSGLSCRAKERKPSGDRDEFKRIEGHGK
ncbi:hypothetical protein HYC85_030948 [Camellia sinensis]|uniref:Uncharacterized protein n=1 Tax=Camellia sinensis TaxID=4442 RepID=A0A7J7FPL4_CAMSI|nr:hypothetical protein HYC85_030948 [Camellia sinensis]